MNEMDILEDIRDPRRLNLLADQFRQGRDIADLLALLLSESGEIVGAAAWIVGEVDIDPQNARLLIPRLRQLVSHENPSIRFHAIGALFPFLDKADPAIMEMLTPLSADPNEGVRSIAQAALRRISQ